MVSSVKKSYRKNILREMKGSMSRVISLFGIVMLGAMMLTGLASFPPSMRIAGQQYYVNQNVFDLRVLSTLGLSEEDIAAIEATEGVSCVMPVRTVDTESRWKGEDTTFVARLQELDRDPLAETEDNMNRLVLLSGRMPEQPGECVVQVLGTADGVELGSVLLLNEESEEINGTQFTVVGVVQDPLHFSLDGTESSTVGDGQVDVLAFVPDGSLTVDYYTTCYIKAENAAQYDNYSDEYQAAVDAVAARLEVISDAQCAQRRTQLIKDANAQLADAKQTYNEQKAEAERQFAEAEQQLAEAEAQLDAAQQQLNNGEAEYASGKAELELQRAALPDTMQSGADQLLAGQEQILEFEEQLQQIELLVNLKQVADPLLSYAEAALDNAQKALDEAEPEDEEYTELRQLLAKAQSSYDSIYGQLEGYQNQLDEGKRQMYEQGLLSAPDVDNAQLVTEAKAALRQMKLSVMQGQLGLSTGTASAYSQFSAAEQQLADARAQLDSGWTEYEAGKEQLEQGRAEYENQKADAEQQLAEGLAQLNDAEEQVSKIKSGEWYVLDRNSTMSIVTFEQYSDRMQAIANVFPVFFFLVAALVATTTMTRMVDENRQQMGALKALGYSSADIAAKYIFYALTAAVLGSIVGTAIGLVVFPLIIWNAYQMIFTMYTFSLRFYPDLALASLAANAMVIGFATWSACRSSLKEKTASLLLPRAPAAGKRIFLEYLTPLWKRMSFSQKTTARNLFRYKKRFFMTVLGVAGCTALLLIGFGIQDSLLPIVEKQSSELTHSDLTVSLSDIKALTVEDGLAQLLDESGEVESWGVFYTRSVTLYNEQGESASVSVVGAEQDEQLAEYFTFRTRKGHGSIPLDDSSVILTEKAAANLGVEPGDTIWVENADGERLEMTLTGVAESYMFPRLYLSRAQLERFAGTAEPEWNTVYGATSCKTVEQCDGLRADILRCNYVSSVSFMADTTQMFDNLIVSLNYVVILIIACAAALAAVVLYNLISVNLAERKKELATIKVLGFYDKEVYRYIFREIDLLALIGSGVGLLLGVPLHRFIVLTVEMDQLMFIRDIAPRSYLLSVALTMVFTLAVCFIMRRHVKKISMVESMKAPE